PKTRKEFEVRADLLHFIKEMEQYLNIKSKFKGIEESMNANEKIGVEGN
ncbi:MAG TPA: aromatic acid exporter family protein, partial [Bacillus sp. (in: firmicutes)]|nr:aromatic acid exporter family protein [Bacillus sp. (in: firmicutes)]